MVPLLKKNQAVKQSERNLVTPQLHTHTHTPPRGEASFSAKLQTRVRLGENGAFEMGVEVIAKRERSIPKMSSNKACT